LLPGIGPLLVAAPLLDAIVGAALGTGLMMTSDASTHSPTRPGLPGDKLEILHQTVMDGKTLLIVYCGYDDSET